MRDVNDDMDQAEHELYNERTYRDLNDDKKEIATLGKQSSNDHCTREEVQHNDYKELMEESLQPSNKLLNDSNTGADIIGIKDHDDDKREDATLGQHTDNDHLARKQTDNSQPYDHGRLVEELLQSDEQLVGMEVDTEILCTATELVVIHNVMNTDHVNNPPGMQK